MRKKVLLAIDLQQQFKDGEGKAEEVVRYIEENAGNYDYIVLTCFSQDIYGSRNELYLNKLHWDGCMSCSIDDLLPNTDKRIVLIKNSYGLTLKGVLNSDSITVDVVGCDADACILATCFRLWDNGYDFNILTKYIYSTAKDIDINTVFAIMKRNFGDCVIE